MQQFRTNRGTEERKNGTERSTVDTMSVLITKNMDHRYRTRWSGQGYISKLIIISVVMYILKQSGIVGGRYFEI